MLNYKVAIIVVTFNRKLLLRQCIEALLKSNYDNFDLFVIDNNSTDGTENDLAEFWLNDKINYLNTGENLGGAGGFHFGIKNCDIKKYDFLWLMDDDTIVLPDTLSNFVSYYNKKQDIGFLTGKVLWKDGSICKMNIPKVNKWKRIKEFDSEAAVHYASFVSLFIRSDVLLKVGLPYKEFFIWGDDWEFTRRISKIYKCIYLPQAVVVHHCNSNVGASIVDCDKERIDRFKYMYRNDVVLYRQDGIEGYVYLFIRTLLHTIRIVLKGKNRISKLKVMYSSLTKGFRFKPQIEYVE